MVDVKLMADCKIVMLGVSKFGSFALETAGDLMCQNAELGGSPGATICFYDIKLDHAKPTAKLFEMAQEDYKADGEPYYRVEVTDQADVAFQDANYIIQAIEAGDHWELWKEDYHVCRQLGARHVWGENGGAGVRSIPGGKYPPC